MTRDKLLMILRKRRDIPLVTKNKAGIVRCVNCRKVLDVPSQEEDPSANFYDILDHAVECITNFENKHKVICEP